MEYLFCKIKILQHDEVGWENGLIGTVQVPGTQSSL
jgi:hypothetical protein